MDSITRPERIDIGLLEEGKTGGACDRERAQYVAELIRNGANPLFAVARSLAPASPSRSQGVLIPQRYETRAEHA